MEVNQDRATLSHIFSPIDLEDLFHRSSGARIINNEDFTSMSHSEDFRRAIYSHTDEALGFTPTCECGYLRGRCYLNMTCSRCGTVVSTDYIDELTHLVWISSPNGAAPFIHPVWYQILSGWQICGKSSGSLLQIALDPDKEVPPQLAPVIQGKGFDYFHAHADAIFTYLFTEFQWNAAGQKKMQWIKLFYDKYRSILFTTKLPILHNSLHPIMKAGSSLKFADKTTKEVLEAVFNLSTVSFVSRTFAMSKKAKDKAMWNIYFKIMKYYESIVQTKLSSKYALLRHECLGSRTMWSFRCVVIPITGAHNADEIYLPYKLVVNSLKLQIINVLVHRKKKTMNEAVRQHLKALVVFDQEVYDIMMLLIKESPHKGYPCILGRNPREKFRNK